MSPEALQTRIRSSKRSSPYTPRTKVRNAQFGLPSQSSLTQSLFSHLSGPWFWHAGDPLRIQPDGLTRRDCLCSRYCTTIRFCNLSLHAGYLPANTSLPTVLGTTCSFCRSRMRLVSEGILEGLTTRKLAGSLSIIIQQFMALIGQYCPSNH